MSDLLPGYLLLEDGSRFDGFLCGASGVATAEVVFTTSMSGYQEAVTDPSYAKQLLVFTYPQIGNYGVCEYGPNGVNESDRVHVSGVIMREAVNYEDAPSAEIGWLDWLENCSIPALTGIDTRALVKHIRDCGAMRGGIFPAECAEAEARAQIAAEPSMNGLDLAQTVTQSEPVILDPDNSGPRIVAIDTGIKNSIVQHLRQRGARVELHPCQSSAQDLLAREPDAIFLANGPGDPAALDYIVATVRELIGKVPIYGICLGHQLLCRALGLETYKLPFGHRGSNHPVKDLASGRIDITSQNHGFAVLGPGGSKRLDTGKPVRWQTDFGTAELTSVNLYDGTVEGLKLLELPVRTVQYHPEAGPGPHDAAYFFDQFIEAVQAVGAT